jgi:IS5 family transposase
MKSPAISPAAPLHRIFGATRISTLVRRRSNKNERERDSKCHATTTIHRRASVATIKYRIFGHPRLLLRGQAGARTELSLAVMVYNLKRMANILGTGHLTKALQQI